jgi:hypothetical protein
MPPTAVDSATGRQGTGSATSSGRTAEASSRAAAAQASGNRGRRPPITLSSFVSVPGVASLSVSAALYLASLHVGRKSESLSGVRGVAKLEGK